MKQKLKIVACVCLMFGVLTSCNHQVSNNSTTSSNDYSSCNSQTSNNSTTSSIDDNSGYISMDEIKTEIYCWKIDIDSWRCGALMLTSIYKTYEELKELQDFYSYTLEEMKNIISIYYSDEDRKHISIRLLTYPVTKDNYGVRIPDKETLAYLKAELGLDNRIINDYAYL